MENQYEHLKFTIQRFDHYFDTVNNKGTFFITLNTFIFGGVCAGYTSLHKDISYDIWIWICLVSLLFSCLISIVFTVSAIIPYTKDNHNPNKSPSLVYFGGIARHELQYVKEKLSEQSPEEMIEDALQQVHSLAKGLTAKFKKIKIASYLMLCQFFLLVPLFFLILKNLKS